MLELQDWLVDRLAEPYHSFSHELRSPLARTDKPRGDNSGKKASGVLVNVYADVAVQLEP